MKIYFAHGKEISREEALSLYRSHSEIQSQGLKTRIKKARGGEYYQKLSAYYFDKPTKEFRYFYILKFKTDNGLPW